MRTRSIAAVAVLSLAAGLVAVAGSQPTAAAQESGTLFHVGTGTKHANIAFVSEAEIETIHGTSNQISGTFWADFEGLTGKTSLKVPVAGLRTGIPTRDEHLQSDQWLDAEQFADITLVSDDIALTVKNADRGIYEATVKGKLTVHGVEQERAITATVIRLPEAIGKKLGAGEWVKISAKFDVKLSDHDVSIPNPEMVGPKVNDTWSVSVSLFATTTPPAPRRRR